MTTDSRLTVISQEQAYQAASLAELRQAVTGLARDLRRLEQEVATLKAAWVASREGAECSDSMHN